MSYQQKITSYAELLKKAKRARDRSKGYRLDNGGRARIVGTDVVVSCYGTDFATVHPNDTATISFKYAISNYRLWRYFAVGIHLYKKQRVARDQYMTWQTAVRGDVPFTVDIKARRIIKGYAQIKKQKDKAIAGEWRTLLTKTKRQFNVMAKLGAWTQDQVQNMSKDWYMKAKTGSTTDHLFSAIKDQNFDTMAMLTIQYYGSLHRGEVWSAHLIKGFALLLTNRRDRLHQLAGVKKEVP